MTAVRTTAATPPPRLPVRDKTGALGRGWGGVSPMLNRLAAERATGILVRERGTLHLADGQVVHVDSPVAPAADVLLTAHGTPAAAAWRRVRTETAQNAANGESGGRHRAAHHLVPGPGLTPGALELCRLTALYDAAYFALAPSGAPGRFRYGAEEGPAAPDVRTLRPVPVAALERETLRRRDLLHRIWPDATPDEAPLAREYHPAPPLLPARCRAVLARVNGVRTASEIARELGRPAFHTLVDVRRLVAAGVVAPCRPAPAGVPAAPEDDVRVDPHVTLLKRLRDALEAL